MAKSDEKSESEPRMKVKISKHKDSRGEWGCCVDRKGRAYCQWLIHGHAFCNTGCEWVEE